MCWRTRSAAPPTTARRAGMPRPARTAAHARSRSGRAAGPVPGQVAPPPRVSGVKLSVWFGLLIVMAIASVETVRHLTSVQGPTEVPLAQFMALSPAEPAFLPPRISAGTAGVTARPVGAPTHYVAPGLGAAIIWQRDQTGEHLSPIGRLAPFTGVHALAPRPDQGLLPIALAGGVGYVEAPRLVAGTGADARRARCAYDAGPPPLSGELLGRRDPGPDRVTIENHASEPAVVKLRDPAGATTASIYIDADSFVVATDLPNGPWRVDIAFGTLWSRSCGRFAAAQQAKRLLAPVLPGAVLDVAPEEAGGTEPTDISDEAFAHD